MGFSRYIGESEEEPREMNFVRGGKSREISHGARESCFLFRKRPIRARSARSRRSSITDECSRVVDAARRGRLVVVAKILAMGKREDDRVAVVRREKIA